MLEQNIMKLFVNDKKFYRTLLSVGVPIALQQLITSGVNMMDNIMLGRLGEIQMSGATLANQFTHIFQICCMGLGMGAGVLTSRFWGMGAKESLKKSVLLMYRMVSVLVLCFSVLTVLFPQQIMSVFTYEKNVVAAGAAYLRISVPCYLLLGFSLTTSLVLRSVGKANIPLFSSIGAFFINVFFNWVFIFGKLGAPRLEIRGAALGTLIARLFEFLFIMGYFLYRDENIQFRFPDFRLECKDLKAEYLRVSIPVLISDSILALGNSAVAVVMGHVGPVFVAANAITTVVQQLSTVVIQGISQAGCVITGNTLGSGEYKKAKDQGVTMTVLGLILGLAGAVIIVMISPFVIGLYDITEETKGLASDLMIAVAITGVFQCVNSVLTKGVLRGGGDTRFLMVADVLFLWCVSIPVGALAGIYWKFPGFWIYVCLRLDQIIKAVWCLFRLKSGKWIKRIQTGEGKEERPWKEASAQ